MMGANIMDLNDSPRDLWIFNAKNPADSSL